jgi:hypothetical protein
MDRSGWNFNFTVAPYEGLVDGNFYSIGFLDHDAEKNVKVGYGLAPAHILFNSRQFEFNPEDKTHYCIAYLFEKDGKLAGLHDVIIFTEYLDKGMSVFQVDKGTGIRSRNEIANGTCYRPYEIDKDGAREGYPPDGWESTFQYFMMRIMDDAALDTIKGHINEGYEMLQYLTENLQKGNIGRMKRFKGTNYPQKSHHMDELPKERIEILKDFSQKRDSFVVHPRDLEIPHYAKFDLLYPKK